MLGLFKKSTQIIAPITGKVVDITEVPDATFSEKMLGNGVAIIPSDGLVVAPVDGVVQSIFQTNHAFGIKTSAGIEIIVHCGIDTVELKGEGFERLIQEGVTVTAGTPILKVNFDFLKDKGYPIITPVIIASETQESNLVLNIGKEVVCGKDVIIEIKK